jgi:hypothetical protein
VGVGGGITGAATGRGGAITAAGLGGGVFDGAVGAGVPLEDAEGAAVVAFTCWNSMVLAPKGAEGRLGVGGSVEFGSGAGTATTGSSFTVEAVGFFPCNSTSASFIASATGTRATPLALSTQPVV